MEDIDHSYRARKMYRRGVVAWRKLPASRLREVFPFSINSRRSFTVTITRRESKRESKRDSSSELILDQCTYIRRGETRDSPRN